MDNICDKLTTLSIDKNKGTGAGGANTTKTGMKFEHITDNEEHKTNFGENINIYILMF